MKHLLVFSLLLFFGASALAQGKMPEEFVRQKFFPGGSIRLHLGSGGYTISGADSNSIGITYKCKTAARLKEIRVRVKVDKSKADLWVQNTPHNYFEASIEVPRHSNLWVRLPAGEVDIEDVEGDKDVESFAGEINIDVPHPEDYGRRDASVLAGDVEASAFSVSKGGLWRSFRQSGSGKYRLHAHVTAGDINLRGPE